MQPCLIRPARLSDLDRILEIENASFNADAWDREIFLGYLQECGEMFLVAKSRGRIQGYSITAPNGERAELASIAVDPANRGRGVGHKLMQHTGMLLRAGRIRTWWLTARVSNATAIGFYRTLGFRRTRTVKSYYEDGEDGWRMQMRLEQPPGA